MELYPIYKWPYNKWVTGVIILPKEVATPFITGKGLPCRCDLSVDLAEVPRSLKLVHMRSKFNPMPGSEV